MEVSEARGAFDTLNERLNNSDSKKADKASVESTRSNLQSQINGLASGSPLVATSVEEMVDTSRVYVNTSNGHWYYHNGASWLDGGVYQSTEIAENSIKPINTTFFNTTYNLIKYWMKNTGLQTTDGMEYEKNIMNATNYMEVIPENIMIFTISESGENDLYYIHYYDETKTQIGLQYLEGMNISKKWMVTIPENAKYARIHNYNPTERATSCLIPEKSSFEEAYDETGYYYNKYIPPFIFNNELIKELESTSIKDNGISLRKLDKDVRDVFDAKGENVVIQNLKNGFYWNYGSLTEQELEGWSYGSINVLEGQKYKITGKSTALAKLYEIVDKNNIILDFYPYVKETGDYSIEVTIPKNATKMYINSINSRPTEVIKINKYTIKKESKLTGKLLSLNGDSLCQGNENENISFGNIIATNNNMQFENIAVGGATIATETYKNETARHWICNTIENMSAAADYILIGGGVNDYWDNVYLGSITNDMSTEVDNTTFYGALEFMCRKLLERFPGKKIGFVIYHKVNRIFNTANDIGITYQNYYDATKEVLEKYSIPYIDLSKLSGFNTELLYYKTNYTCGGDGIHPTTEGYNKFYVDKITNFMKSL